MTTNKLTKFLHGHPWLESKFNLYEHIIVDKDDWEKVTDLGNKNDKLKDQIKIMSAQLLSLAKKNNSKRMVKYNITKQYKLESALKQKIYSLREELKNVKRDKWCLQQSSNEWYSRYRTQFQRRQEVEIKARIKSGTVNDLINLPKKQKKVRRKLRVLTNTYKGIYQRPTKPWPITIEGDENVMEKE